MKSYSIAAVIVNDHVAPPVPVYRWSFEQRVRQFGALNPAYQHRRGTARRWRRELRTQKALRWVRDLLAGERTLVQRDHLRHEWRELMYAELGQRSVGCWDLRAKISRLLDLVVRHGPKSGWGIAIPEAIDAEFRPRPREGTRALPSKPRPAVGAGAPVGLRALLGEGATLPELDPALSDPPRPFRSERELSRRLREVGGKPWVPYLVPKRAEKCWRWWSARMRELRRLVMLLDDWWAVLLAPGQGRAAPAAPAALAAPLSTGPSTPATASTTALRISGAQLGDEASETGAVLRDRSLDWLAALRCRVGLDPTM